MIVLIEDFLVLASIRKKGAKMNFCCFKLPTYFVGIFLAATSKS